jgi:endonuclease III
MQKKERYKAFIEYFNAHQPDADTELQYGNSFQLLISVILSAQCTDKRVNLVTPPLFEQFPNPESLAEASFEEVFPFIKSVSYPNNKTRHLIGMSRMLVDDFGSQVPSDLKDLQKLPGVGRKTANVVANVIFKQATMPVDTHVFRVSKRIGLADQNAKTPLEVEKQLVSNIPKKYLSKAHHWLILHGRYVCIARKPKCEECKISFLCKYYEKNYSLPRVMSAGSEK